MAASTGPRNVNYLTPSIFLREEVVEEKSKSDVVEFVLKVKAGSGVKAETYKKKVGRFFAGNATSWIEVCEDLEEIWNQNSITAASDREANVKALLRDDALTAFEAAIDTAQKPVAPAVDMVDLTTKMVDDALGEVAKEIFPHRALEIQKLWMRRVMRKPKDMTARKMAAAIVRMNSKLIRFPGAEAKDTFSAAEILEIIEFGVPAKWRDIFDLKGYVPSLHNRARLIQECEMIERSESSATPSSIQKNHKKHEEAKHRTQKSNGNGNGRKPGKTGQFHCTEHGQNMTHATSGCFTLKNRAKLEAEARSSSAPKTFSNNKFRKEVNLLSKGKNKKKVLNLYAAAIKKERTLLKAKTEKARTKKALEDAAEESSSDDDDMEVNLLEITEKHQTVAKKATGAKKLRDLAVTNTKVRFLATVNSEMKTALAKAVRLNPQKRTIEQANASDEEQAFQASIDTLGQAKESKTEEDSSDPSSEEEEPMKE